MKPVLVISDELNKVLREIVTCLSNGNVFVGKQKGNVAKTLSFSMNEKAVYSVKDIKSTTQGK